MHRSRAFLLLTLGTWSAAVAVLACAGGDPVRVDGDDDAVSDDDAGQDSMTGSETSVEETDSELSTDSGTTTDSTSASDTGATDDSETATESDSETTGTDPDTASETGSDTGDPSTDGGCTAAPVDSCGGTTSWCNDEGVCVSCGSGSCGNDRCDCGETFLSCFMDCENECGDTYCAGGETHCTCPEDCTDPVLATTWDDGDEDWTWLISNSWERGQCAGGVSCAFAGDNHLYFEGAPQQSGFTRYLSSPLFSLEGCATASVGFASFFDDDPGVAGSNALALECLNGSSSFVEIWRHEESAGDLAATTQTVALDPGCTDLAYTRVRFVASGADSLGITVWRVDDVQVF